MAALSWYTKFVRNLLPPNEKLLPGFDAGAAEAPFPAVLVSVFPNWNVEETADCWFGAGFPPNWNTPELAVNQVKIILKLNVTFKMLSLKNKTILTWAIILLGCCRYMTSDDFQPFLTPPPPPGIRCFVSAPLNMKSNLAEYIWCLVSISCTC